MKRVALMLSIACLTTAAQAEPLKLSGRFGYLSEYELVAEVARVGAPDAAGGARVYAGAMTVTHVGLCKHDGPERTAGQISLQIAEAGTTPRATATLHFGGRECRYAGPLAEKESGEMSCPGVDRLPFSLWPAD